MPRFEKPPRILLWITLLWLIIFVVAFSDAGVPFPTWFLMAGAFVILGVAWVVRAVVAITKQSGYQRLIRPHIRYWVSIPPSCSAQGYSEDRRRSLQHASISVPIP
jgi:hypothetical protein